MCSKSLKVVAFAGSLRRESLNRLLLKSAISLAPEGMVIEELDISDVPLFNQDVEEEGPPQSVISFKESVGAADGLINVVANSLTTRLGSQYSFTGLTSGSGERITGSGAITTESK